MKKLWWLFALLVPGFPLFAQTGALQGHCYLGGTPATTSGANSSNYLNGIIPACTVKVYLHGTTTLATIYADGNNTPLANPFTANTASAVDPGGWIFYGVTNQGVDVVLSGGNSNPNCTTTPLCYAHSVTLSDVFPSQSFTPAAGVAQIIPGTNITISPPGGTGAVTISGMSPAILVTSSPYNAKCDGVTDDTAAFRSALQAGYTVEIPNATCAVSGALYFSGERIIGTSMTQSVLKWIGPSPSMPTSISAASVTSNVATITTTTAHGLQPNETVVVEGVTNTVFNGTFIVTSVPTTTTFTYALVTANTSSSGGTAGMYYLLDSSKTPAGGTPSTFNFVEGWLSNLTVNCNSVAGVSGIFQQGDNGGANNILVENCVDGYTSYQGYMGPATHVVAKNSSSQGIFIKNLPGQLNGSTQGGSLWANGFGTYGIHIRATPGKFDLLYAQSGGANATYPIFFEGDSPGVTRTPGLECANCVVDGGGGVNSFRIRRYYLTMDSMNVYTSTPSGDVVVFDDAWGTVTNPNIYAAPAVGHYDFASLGTSSGLSGEILLIGGGGTINPTNSTDFSGMGFLNGTATTAAILASDGVVTAPSYAFLSEPGLGMYRTGSGTIGFGASSAEMAQISAGGIATLGKISFCSGLPFTCYGGVGQNGTDEIVTFDHNGTVSGGNFSANILRVGINSTDTGISRIGAGVFGFGNGTQGNASATIEVGSIIDTGITTTPSTSPICPNGTGGAFTTTGCTGSSISGTINAATQYSPSYYSAAGSSTTLSGITPFTGLGYWSTTAAPAAATAAQVVGVIGTTAVTNSTNTTNLLGGATGSVPYQSAANTTAMLAAGLTGQTLTTTNASAPAWESAGLAEGNGGAPVTTTYTVQCDSATAVLDRGTVINFTGTAATTITLPDPTTTGCGNNFALIIANDGTATVTVSRTTTATFTVANGSSVTNSATSFSLPAGSFVSINSPDNANWLARLNTAGTGVTLQTNGTANTSQTTLNLINSSTNAAGLTLTETNTTLGTVQGEIAGTVNLTHGGTGGTTAAAGLSNLLGNPAAGSYGVTCASTSSCTYGTITATSSATTTNTVANAGTTGTTVNTLVKYTGAPSTAVITATTDTDGAVGIVTAGAGTTGNATITTSGLVNCVFSNATTAGDYVQISATTAGNCSDAGATKPTSGQIIGVVLSTNATAGTYQIDLWPHDIAASSGGSGAFTLVYNTPQTGTAASLASTTMVTPGANTFYDIDFVISQTVLTAGCTAQPTVTLNVTYTDALTSNAVSVAPYAYEDIFNNFNWGPTVAPPFTLQSSSNGFVTYTTPPKRIYAKSAVAVAYSTTYAPGTGCTTGATYVVMPQVVTP